MAIFTSQGTHLNCAIRAMLYTHSIGNQPQNTMVVFNSLHPRVRKRNFPCNDDNVAFMQQVHRKTTGKQSVFLIV